MSQAHLPPSNIRILLVEDNAGDVNLTRRALKASVLASALDIVGDGEQALAFLRKEGAYSEAERPDLIVMDLNLPRLDGHEVLRSVRSDAGLKDIPVVMFTTSDAKGDVLESYRLSANCYVTKPLDATGFSKAVLAIEQFWSAVAKLPRA